MFDKNSKTGKKTTAKKPVIKKIAAKKSVVKTEVKTTAKAKRVVVKNPSLDPKLNPEVLKISLSLKASQDVSIQIDGDFHHLLKAIANVKELNAKNPLSGLMGIIARRGE